MNVKQDTEKTLLYCSPCSDVKKTIACLSHCVWIVTTQRKITIFVMYHKELLQLNIVGVQYFHIVRLLMCLVANSYLKTICIVWNNFIFVFFLAILKCLVPCIRQRSRSTSETKSKKKTKKHRKKVSVAVLYMFLMTQCYWCEKM